MRRLSQRAAICAAALSAVMNTSNFAEAASASWAAAASGVWNSAGNWSPASIPNSAADNATISIGGTYTVTLSTNQTVNTLAVSSANATLSHTTGTLTAANINLSAGTYSLAGGLISGAAITLSGGGTFLPSNNGNNRLVNNTVLNGNLVYTGGQLRFESGSTFTGASGTLSAGAVLGWQQTGAFTGKTVTLAGSSLFAIEGSNTLTLAATSTVRGSGSSTFGPIQNIGGTNGLINDGTIVAVAGNFTVSPNNLTNNSFIGAGAGSRVLLNAGAMSNAGTIEAAGGGSVTVNQFQTSTWTNTAAGRIRVGDATSHVLLAGNWSNAGSIILNQGTLTLDGTFTRGGIGTINRTGGTIDLGGFLNNAGGTLTLNATTGDYRINGAVISGGTITSTGGGTLLFANNGANRLADSAVLVGDVVLNNARLRLQSGSSFTGANGTMNSGSVFGYEQTGTLTGKTITLDSNSFFAIEGNNTLTLAATTTVRGSNSSVFGQTFAVGGTNGLINNGTITATGGGQLSVNPSNFTNNALATATAGSRLSLAAGSFTNAGTVEASGGGSVTINLFANLPWINTAAGRIRVADANSSALLAGNWSNAGSIILNQGTLTLDGTFTRGGIGTVNRTGGTIDIAGFLGNSGGTFSLNGTTGDYRMNGGVVSGGTVTSAGGGTLLFANNGFNRLADNAVLVGNLLLNNARLRLQSGSSFTGANGTLTSSIFGYEQTGTLTGKTFNLDFSTFSIEGTNTLTLASSTTVRGANNSVFGQTFAVGGTNGLVNNGTIGATSGQFNVNPSNLTNNAFMGAAAGARLTLAAGSFSNAGTVQAIGGGSVTINLFQSTPWVNTAAGRVHVADANSLAILGGNWSNAGSIILNQGTLILDGTFTRGGIGTINRTGGTLDVAGFLNNAGGTLTLNATTGDYRLSGGIISGGTITTAGGGTLLFTNNGANRLTDNATLVGDLILNNARLRLQSGSSFTGANGSFTNGSVFGYEQTGTLNGKTINLINSTFAIEGTNTLTIGATTTVRGSGALGDTFAVGGTTGLVNNGTITGNGATTTLTLNPDSLSNNGTLAASNGGRLVVLPAVNLGGNPGRLRADGLASIVNIQGGTYTINQPAVVANHGLIWLQGTFTKAATFDASGRFVFDYTGAGNTPLAQIKADIISGFAGGAWNGAGINSTAAAGSITTGVGYAEASSVLTPMGGSFAGIGVDGTAVLVRYTLRGDSNLDGTVNLDDFTRLAAGFGIAGVWSTGDSNYDGTVNLDDFTALAANFGLSLGGDLPRSAVPEPVAPAAVLLVTLAGSRRRFLRR